MSFDLFFCWERQVRIDFGSVCSWAEGFAYFEREENQLWYRNEDTGVYFSLDFAGEPSGDTEGPEIPEGYFDSGLSFNLNFNRPSYFGYEAMPIVENLATKFGLCAFNPQGRDSEHLLLRNVNSNDLLQSWLDHNRRAILTMIEHVGLATPPELSLEKSLYRWNYSKDKKNLQATCGDQIFAPTLLPVRRVGSNHAELAFVCTQGVPCLVPISDWVFIVRQRKAHFWSGKQQEVGVVSARRFRGLVSGKLEEFNSQLSLWLLPPLATTAVNKLLQTCDFDYPKEEFEVLALDGFVDIDTVPKTAPN
jgi:hypothetical protein